jgi:hypothetical protein
MAANRPMRNRQSRQVGYSLQNAKGHEFQEDRPHDLALSAFSQTPRNVFSDSVRIYQTDPAAAFQSLLASGTLDPSMAALIAMVQRKANFVQLPFQYTVVPQLVLPQGSRTYFLIQNLDVALNIFTGFNFKPNGPLGIGLRVQAGQAYEPALIPQNDIWVAGNGTGQGMILYAIG